MRCPVYNMNRNQAPPLIGGNKQSIVQLKKHEHLIKHGDAGEWRGGGESVELDLSNCFVISLGCAGMREKTSSLLPPLCPKPEYAFTACNS